MYDPYSLEQTNDTLVSFWMQHQPLINPFPERRFCDKAIPSRYYDSIGSKQKNVFNFIGKKYCQFESYFSTKAISCNRKVCCMNVPEEIFEINFQQVRINSNIGILFVQVAQAMKREV